MAEKFHVSTGSLEALEVEELKESEANYKDVSDRVLLIIIIHKLVRMEALLYSAYQGGSPANEALSSKINIGFMEILSKLEKSQARIEGGPKEYKTLRFLVQGL